MIPIDGQIVHGYALIDQRALTGESQPIEKKVGDTCFASTMILEGHIHVRRVEKTGSEAVMTQIETMLNNTLDFKDEMISKGERLADESTLPLLTIGTLSMPFIGLGHQFDKHMSNNIWSSLLPSAVTIGGALFFHFGIAAAIVMNQVGLMVGIGNSMQPLLTLAEAEKEAPIVLSKESIEIEPVVEKEEQRELNNEIKSISYESTASYELQATS